ncbi:MAG TPA: hypothetical protein VGH28_06060 [Polyangiaceae bacterium]
MRHVWLALVCASCAAGRPPAVTLKAAAASSSVAPSAPRERCELAFDSPKRLAISPQLARLGPQYFHASTRDGFEDLVPGTSRYAWFDPSNLDVAVDPPADWVTIRRSTPSFFFGWSSDDSLHVARRSDGVTATLPVSRTDLDVIEDEHDAWVLAGDRENLELVRVRPSLEIKSWPLVAAMGNEVDRQIAETASGHVVVLYPMHTIEGLELEARWLGPSGFESMTIDRVAMDDDAAELSLRSRVALSAAADGDGIAVAWRPLSPKKRVDVGSRSTPPPEDAAAEVRIISIAPGRASLARVYPTVAEKLDFTTGIGPWPLGGNGMIAGSVRDHAFFAWIDRGNVLVATPHDEKPHAIAKGEPRLLTRKARDGAELLLLSVDAQSLVPIACR